VAILHFCVDTAGDQASGWPMHNLHIFSVARVEYFPLMQWRRPRSEERPGQKWESRGLKKSYLNVWETYIVLKRRPSQVKEKSFLSFPVSSPLAITKTDYQFLRQFRSLW